MEALQLVGGRREALTQAGPDLDIGVKPAGGLGIREKSSIAMELEQLFKVPRVDLVDMVADGLCLRYNR